MSRRLVPVLPLVAVAVSEAGWIAVLGALAGVAGGATVPAGPWTLAAVVLVAMLVARRSRRAAAILVPGAALAAWAVTTGTAGPGPGLAPAGLAALASWRGSRHADPASDDVIASDLLRFGLPGLAVPWLVGTAAMGAGRVAFMTEALPATLLFVAGSLAAVGLTRLEVLGRESGLDWTRNRAWLVLLAAVLVALVALAVPASLLLGLRPADALRDVLAPAALVAGAAAGVLRAVGDALAGAVPSLPLPSLPVVPSFDPPWWLVAAGAGAAVACGLAAIFWVAIASRGPRVRRVGWRDAPAPDRAIEFSVALPRIEFRPRLPRALRRRRPRTATEAYLAALTHLEIAPAFARLPAESPRRHAARVAGAVGWRLRLLAADYELERYARRRLPAAELRRALARAEGIRRR